MTRTCDLLVRHTPPAADFGPVCLSLSRVGISHRFSCLRLLGHFALPTASKWFISRGWPRNWAHSGPNSRVRRHSGNRCPYCRLGTCARTRDQGGSRGCGRRSGSQKKIRESLSTHRIVRFYGDTAIVTGVNAAPGPRSEGQQTSPVLDHYRTEVWTLVGGNWRLASMHVSFPSTWPTRETLQANAVVVGSPIGLLFSGCG